MLCFFYIACDVSITLAEQTSTILKKLFSGLLWSSSDGGTSFLTKFLSCPLLLSVIESQEKGGANMDFSLMDDLNHFFDVFNTRTENSLKKNLPPESADIASKAVSEEVKLLREVVLFWIEEHLNR